MDMWIIVVTVLSVASAATVDYTVTQLADYKAQTENTTFTLTTSAGKPVTIEESNGVQNNNPNDNEFYLDSITHITSETIPARIVHAKGSGAFGYFEVTQNVTEYTKAKLFSSVGKQTPLAVRFSLATGAPGSSDVSRNIRGWGIKFYTEEGNFDLLTLSTPVFLDKEPARFPSFVHAFRNNPVTNVNDPNMLWDLISHVPSALYTLTYLLSEQGIPDGYRNVNGYSIHTMQLENENDELYFARFHLYPENGATYLNSTAAAAITDIDYAGRDLYNAIAAGNYPVWIMYIQVLSLQDVKDADFDVFDVTMSLPLDKYPLQEVGKLVLNENPTNYFSDVEQIGLCPSNLVPGISGAPDAFFESRRQSYRLARNYRLGINSNNIPINRPKGYEARTYVRNGLAPLDVMNNQAPSYFPNSFNGPAPTGHSGPGLIKITQDFNVTNLGQANDRYINLTTDQQQLIQTNIAGALSTTDETVQDNVIAVLASMNTTLAESVATILEAILAASN